MWFWMFVAICWCVCVCLCVCLFLCCMWHWMFVANCWCVCVCVCVSVLSKWRNYHRYVNFRQCYSASLTELSPCLFCSHVWLMGWKGLRNASFYCMKSLHKCKFWYVDKLHCPPTFYFYFHKLLFFKDEMYTQVCPTFENKHSRRRRRHRRRHQHHRIVFFFTYWIWPFKMPDRLVIQDAEKTQCLNFVRW